MWLLSEIAIAATDLAESLGSAVAINLLFHIPLLWAVVITAFDVVVLLSLKNLGMRMIEAIVAVLVSTIAICYFIEIFVLPQTHPSFAEMGRSLISPNFHQSGMMSRGHRHHRRYGHAPQPIFALGARAVSQTTER